MPGGLGVVRRRIGLLTPFFHYFLKPLLFAIQSFLLFLVLTVEQFLLFAIQFPIQLLLAVHGLRHLQLVSTRHALRIEIALQ